MPLEFVAHILCISETSSNFTELAPILKTPSDDLLIRLVPPNETPLSLISYNGVVSPDFPKLTVPAEVCFNHICPPISE